MFSDAENTFVALGLPFTDFINVVNAGLSNFVGELTKNLQPGSGGRWDKASANLHICMPTPPSDYVVQ